MQPRVHEIFVRINQKRGVNQYRQKVLGSINLSQRFHVRATQKCNSCVLSAASQLSNFIYLFVVAMNGAFHCCFVVLFLHGRPKNVNRYFLK